MRLFYLFENDAQLIWPSTTWLRGMSGEEREKWKFDSMSRQEREELRDRLAIRVREFKFNPEDFGMTQQHVDEILRSLPQKRRISLANTIKAFKYKPEDFGMTQQEVDQLTRKEDPPSFIGTKVVRYVLENGMGLMNRGAYDMNKLSSNEALDLMDGLATGLQQPLGVDGGNVFAFTPEGEKRHKKLLSLLKKAARAKVRRIEMTVGAEPTWVSGDGQVAFKEKPVRGKDGQYTIR